LLVEIAKDPMADEELVPVETPRVVLRELSEPVVTVPSEGRSNVGVESSGSTTCFLPKRRVIARRWAK